MENPARAARRRKRAKRQEEVWASKAGEVKTTYVCVCPSPNCKASIHGDELDVQVEPTSPGGVAADDVVCFGAGEQPAFVAVVACDVYSELASQRLR